MGRRGWFWAVRLDGRGKESKEFATTRQVAIFGTRKIRETTEKAWEIDGVTT